MDEDDEMRLQHNHKLIVNNVRLGDVVDQLLSDFVLDENLFELIKLKTTERKRIHQLLRILPTRGQYAYKSFRKALSCKACYQHIVTALDGTNLVEARNLLYGAVKKPFGPSTSGVDVTNMAAMFGPSPSVSDVTNMEAMFEPSTSSADVTNMAAIFGPSTSGAVVTNMAAIFGPSTSRGGPHETRVSGLVSSFHPTDNVTKVKTTTSAAIPARPIKNTTKRDVIIPASCATQLASLDDLTLDVMSLEIRGQSSCDVINEVTTVQAACAGPSGVGPSYTPMIFGKNVVAGNRACHEDGYPADVAAAACAIVPNTRCLGVNYKDKGGSSTIIPASGASGVCRLCHPTGVAYCSHTNTILVADFGNQRIMRYDMDGSNGRHFVRSGDTDCSECTPCDVATGRVSGRVFVTDIQNQRVLVFTSDGDYVTSFGSRGTGVGQFSGAWGITCHNGCVLVCDVGNHRVTMVTEDGVHIRHIATGELSHPCYVAVGPGNTIFVTNCDVIDGRHYGNVRVYCWDGSLVGQFGDREGAGGVLPFGVTVNHQGYVCVAWKDHDRVDVYNPHGELHTTFGTFGREGDGPDELGGPHGLELLPDGRIVACDYDNNRLVIF